MTVPLLHEPQAALSQTKRPDLSISIVSFNRGDLVTQCLSSVRAHTRSVTYEVHLVAHEYDPAALEALKSSHAGIVVHRVSGIRGYSQNNNVALRAARGRYVAILNDDTVFQSDVFGQLVGFLERDPSVVAACPVLRNQDGSLQKGLRGRLTPWGVLLHELKLDRLVPPARAAQLGTFDCTWLPADVGEAVDIEAGTGACFVARREALEAIGFLDEVFFLGPDDVDWTQRLRRQVGRVVILPHVSLTHLGGATLGPRYRTALPTVYAGCYTFLRRYYGRAAEWLVRLIVGFVWSGLLTVAWYAVWLLSGSGWARTVSRARWSCVRFAFSGLSSSEIFAWLLRSP